ncbi:hypothetical protein D7W79_42860 [Corallococcus exercitus]|nr:hypothetical protein D7W79_42860 [Corallococcus exercitus]
MYKRQAVSKPSFIRWATAVFTALGFAGAGAFTGCALTEDGVEREPGFPMEVMSLLAGDGDTRCGPGGRLPGSG